LKYVLALHHEMNYFTLWHCRVGLKSCGLLRRWLGAWYWHALCCPWCSRDLCLRTQFMFFLLLITSIYYFVRGCDMGLYYCIWVIYIACILGRFQRRFCIWGQLFCMALLLVYLAQFLLPYISSFLFINYSTPILHTSSYSIPTLDT